MREDGCIGGHGPLACRLCRSVPTRDVAHPVRARSVEECRSKDHMLGADTERSTNQKLVSHAKISFQESLTVIHVFRTI